MRYHNSTRSSGSQLDRYEGTAKAQDQQILEHIKKHWHIRDWTPSELQTAIFGNDVPLTSVRRAVTNLTKRYELVKTDVQRRGPYGRPEYCWKLPQQQGRLF